MTRPTPPWDTASVGRSIVVDPGLHALEEEGVALAARRQEAPFVPLALGDEVCVLGPQLGGGEPFPVAECDLPQAVVEAIGGGVEAHREAGDLHRLTRPDERARDEIVAGDAGNAVGDGLAVPPCLAAALVVERDVALALKAALDIPVGLAVADEDEGGEHARGLPGAPVPGAGQPSALITVAMSGASTAFMPTTW